MARQLKKETIANLSSRFDKLNDAVKAYNAEEHAFVQTSEKMTQAGKRDAMARIFKLQNEAIEHATYLGSVFGAFLTGIAAKSPERIAYVFKVLEPDLPNIVEAINEVKEEKRDEAEERKSAEINQKANELLARLAAKEAEANSLKAGNVQK